MFRRLSFLAELTLRLVLRPNSAYVVRSQVLLFSLLSTVYVYSAPGHMVHASDLLSGI